MAPRGGCGALRGGSPRIQPRAVNPPVSTLDPRSRVAGVSDPTYCPAMGTYVRSVDPTEPLVKVAVYMYAKERQQVREQASHRGMAMSEYVKWLIDQDRRGVFGSRR